MIYNLLAQYAPYNHLANLLHYITFRAALAALMSLIISFLIGPILIKYLKRKQTYGQPIRNDIPLAHQAKVGTPTMGGIMIIISTIIPTMLLVNLNNKYIWIVLFVFVSFGLLGFCDDYAKIAKNNHKGVSGKAKLITQIIFAIIACVLIRYVGHQNPYVDHLAFPFFKNLLFDLGYFYIPFGVFVIVGSSNAVNLTDGLDGLAIMPIAIVAASFVILSYVVGNSFYAHYLQILYIPTVAELSIFCAAIIGSSLGFLWFNAQPAEIFMGDIGSLSLGGVFGVISVIVKHEIVLAIIGGVFVIETLSVIIQVYYFKHTGGKRIFKMAPLHHHFEKQGWPESKVVIRFWIIAVVFALIGLSSLKLR